MNVMKKLLGQKAEKTSAIEDAMRGFMDQLPSSCDSLSKALRLRELVSAVDSEPRSKDAWAEARRAGRPLDVAVTKLRLFERLAKVSATCAEHLARAQHASDRYLEEWQVAKVSTEQARSKLAAAEKRHADLQREREGLVSTGTAAVDASRERLNVAVVSGDAAAEQEAGVAFSETQERQRAQRTTLAALGARLESLARLIAQLDDAVAEAEGAERQAERQVRLAAVDLLSVKCDQVSETYIDALASVVAAMRAAQAVGVPAGQMLGYTSLAETTLWVGDCERSLLGNEQSPKGGNLPVHWTLAALAPMEDGDVAQLYELDETTLASMVMHRVPVAWQP